MDPLSSLLLFIVVVSIALWAGLSVYVLAVERRRAAMRRVLASAVETLQDDAYRRLPEAERHARLAALLQDASRDLILSVAAQRETPDEVFGPLTSQLAERGGVASLVRDASSHRSSR